VDTTENLSISFHAMPNDSAAAVRANRRETLDRALEAVENMTFSANDNFKGLVIIVSADFACGHTHSFARDEARGGVYLPLQEQCKMCKHIGK
jgi:hypothetical protein